MPIPRERHISIRDRVLALLKRRRNGMSVQSIYDRCSGSSEGSVRTILSLMVRYGDIRRVRRGVYALPEAEKEGEEC
jgi:predicted transcriptional regulator of viral defense system